MFPEKVKPIYEHAEDITELCVCASPLHIRYAVCRPLGRAERENERMANGIDPIELAGEIVEKTLGSEPVTNLLGPMTKELGLLFGDIGSVVRYYGKQNLLSIFTKWANRRNDEPLASEAFKRILPLLQDAAMESDDELQERWASLLENVANNAYGVLPSFGSTLSQLTPVEARYLDRIWERVTAPKPYNSGKREGRDELSYLNLADLYDSKLRAPSPAEMRIYKDRMSPEQLAAFDEVTKFELILHDLERLRLLEKLVQYMPGDTGRYEIGGEIVSVQVDQGGTKTSYALTQYGVNFILSVQPKNQKQG